MVLDPTKLKIEDIGRKRPIGCECINPHDQGVILAAIDSYMRIIDKNITEIKSNYRKREMYKDVLDTYANEKINLESTKKKVMNIPPCK